VGADQQLYLLIAGEPQGRLRRAAEFCHEVRMACHLFQGITHSTMSHNEAWHFIRLGTALERADKTTRILDVKYFILLPSVTDVGTPYDDVQWSAVLKSVSGFEMYRKKLRPHRARPGRGVPAARRRIPARRALLHRPGRRGAARHHRHAPGGFSCASEQRIGLLRSELDYARGGHSRSRPARVFRRAADKNEYNR
jgi:hypothetical protein